MHRLAGVRVVFGWVSSLSYSFSTCPQVFIFLSWSTCTQRERERQDVHRPSMQERTLFSERSRRKRLSKSRPFDAKNNMILVSTSLLIYAYYTYCTVPGWVLLQWNWCRTVRLFVWLKPGLLPSLSPNDPLPRSFLSCGLILRSHRCPEPNTGGHGYLLDRYLCF